MAMDAAATALTFRIRRRKAIAGVPFRVILDCAVSLSVDYNLQELRRAVEPLKVGRIWERRSADSLAAFYLSNTSSIFKLLIDQSDSLFLSKAQVTALHSAD